jgi:hypothetical protein
MPEGRKYLKDLDVDGRIISNRIFKMRDGARTGLIWLRIGQVMSSCECGNEPSVFIK